MADTTTQARRIAPATIALALAGLLALASIVIFASRSGEPGAQPVANAAQGASIEEMVAGLEQRLRQDPDNAADWRMLGWTYFEIARRAESDEAFRNAVARSAVAYRRATELEPGNAENWSSLGEVLQVVSTDVSPEAEQAFRRALQLDPADARARYFTAVHKDLRGAHAAAIEDWLALLSDTPAGAPWEADLRRTITQTAERHDIDIAGRLPEPRPAPASTATAAIPGPTREQMAAASAIPPAQQNEMVKGMVDRLAARLQSNPRDAEGWIRLMRSRMVLGERDAAGAALRSGLAAFDGDSAAQGQLRTAARELGVPGA